MNTFKLKIKENFYQLFVLLLAGIVFSIWAYRIPFNNAPDELMRYQIPQFIFKYGRLPTGYDPEVIYGLGNWSYAFYPQFLGSILSTFFMGIISIFKNSDHAILFGARMASILFGMITVWFTGKSIEIITKSKIISILGMILISFLPQFTFLSSYVNNDIIAVAGASIIVYVSIKAYQHSWTIYNSVLLAIGFIICGLGYLNSYGFILMGSLFFIVSNFLDFRNNELNWKKIKLYTLIVFSLNMIISFPFFMRNYILYNDFLGMRTFRKEYTRWLSEGGQILQQPYQGNIFNLLNDTNNMKIIFHSFVGQFNYMTIIMEKSYYNFYLCIFIIAIIGIIYKLVKNILTSRKKIDNKKIFLNTSIILSCLITIGLHIYYMLKIDYQAQGRYIMAISS
ncbi:hypothetical protein PaeCFBP13512_23230, partial [Paenibacillus sp. CFBP13512]|uniref:glycosyltransferase family 39 protein n=1 Tax=Paenibacillus sp. CFBP13512 TaxID=2184007 RepID=UPI0010C116C5